MNQPKDIFLLNDFVSSFGVPLKEDRPRVQENAKKIMETLKDNNLPEKLDALSQWLREFQKKYFIPIFGNEVTLDNLRLIHCPQWIIGLWIGSTSLYITDMLDPNDHWTPLSTPYINRFRIPMFSLRTVLPVGDDTFLVVVGSKYPASWWPYLERLHLVNIKNRTSITVPEDVGEDAQLIHYVNREISIKENKIHIRWELVENINEYLSQCDDTNDMAESRSYRWSSFEADCEIDRKTGKMTYTKI